MVDLEGRCRYTPQAKDAVFWNGEDDPMSLPKSASRTYILETVDLGKLSIAKQWLQTLKVPWKSISIDSAMEWKYLIENDLYPGRSELEPKEKGKINKVFEEAIRSIRDLTTDPKSPVKCVMIISGASTDPFSGHIKPIITGKIGELLPYWMDLVGYQEAVTKMGSKIVKRELHLAQRSQNDLEVGDGTNRIIQKLGSPLYDPTVEELYNALQDEKTKT